MTKMIEQKPWPIMIHRPHRQRTLSNIRYKRDSFLPLCLDSYGISSSDRIASWHLNGTSVCFCALYIHIFFCVFIILSIDVLFFFWFRGFIVPVLLLPMFHSMYTMGFVYPNPNDKYSRYLYELCVPLLGGNITRGQQTYHLVTEKKNAI